MSTSTVSISVKVNGTAYEREVPARTLLVHFLREELGLTGTNIGCETSLCGACTVMLDGQTAKSCTMLAAQADGAEIITIEGIADGDKLSAVQEGFWEKHGLQCGYCTPGMVISATYLLANNPNPSEAEIRDGLKGNLCRCTGYHNIVEAVQFAAEKMS